MLLIASTVFASAADLRVVDLRTEYAVDPLGIDVAQPRLYWRVEADAAVREVRQTAYQILVASSAETLTRDAGDLWDSGRVESDETTHIAYGGEPLAQIVGTDDAWRVHPGAITYNSIYGGEDYDARRLPVGWDRADFAAAETWERAVFVVRPSMETLRGHSYAAEPLRAIETRAPTVVRELKPGVVLYDFGQNASFMPRVRVSGPAGATVRLTPGEVINDDGTIDRGTMGGAHRGSAWWQYTKATNAEETWFPQLYYVGSRYLYVELQPASSVVAVGDDPGPASARPATAATADLPKLESLEMVIVHSVARPLGHFATSNPRLNAIRDLVRWDRVGEKFTLKVTIPANTTATVFVPARDGGARQHRVGSGEHVFEAK